MPDSESSPNPLSPAASSIESPLPSRSQSQNRQKPQSKITQTPNVCTSKSSIDSSSNSPSSAPDLSLELPIPNLDLATPLVSPTPSHFYSHANGELWHGNAIDWLKTLSSETIDLIIADPPYNIKKADWDTFESQQAYLD